MTDVPAQPGTALTLLFGPDEKNLDTLTDTVLTAGTAGDLGRALKKLPPPTRAAAAREVTAATAELLDINLIDVLLRGWREYADLTSAARRTLAAPGTTELVSLASHRVRMSQQPSVAVLVDGRQVADLHLGLSLVFEVKALLARVRAGRLAAVVAGSCDVTATLAIDDIDIASKQTHLELPGEAALAKPLRLLPARDYPPGDDDAKTAGNAAETRERQIPATDRDDQPALTGGFGAPEPSHVTVWISRPDGRPDDLGGQAAPRREGVFTAIASSSGVRSLKILWEVEFRLLSSKAIPRLALAVVDGAAEFFRLEREHVYLLCVELALFRKLLRLDLKHLGLVANLPGLLAEGQDSEGSGDDREHREDRRGHRGELGRDAGRRKGIVCLTVGCRP